MRASRPGGSGSGGDSHGFVVVRRTLLALFAAVAARLAFLQVFAARDYAARAESQRTNRITLHAKRGTIYDRNGNVLAMSEECSTVYANPEEVSDPSGVAAALVAHLGGDKQDYMDLLTQDTTFVYLRRQVEQETADALKGELAEKDLAGVYYLADTRRVYPYGNVGAQVLGYVGVDGQGLSGIEQQYDDVLTGTDGEMLVETGLYGTPIAGGASQVTEARDGTDLVLSIDIDLQEACETAIAQGVKDYTADSGSAMIIEPRTGEVLAACSTPLPDFSNLTDPSSLNLKLVSSSFEPGSIFKVITTAIGIDDGLFSPDTTYSVPPAYTVGSDTVRDDDLRDYQMDMDVREMMRRSSNTAMALLAEEVIGAKAFSEGVDRWGIGHKTGIDFPGEVEGHREDARRVRRLHPGLDVVRPGRGRPARAGRAGVWRDRQRGRPVHAALPRGARRRGGGVARGRGRLLGRDRRGRDRTCSSRWCARAPPKTPRSRATTSRPRPAPASRRGSRAATRRESSWRRCAASSTRPTPRPSSTWA